MRIRSLSASLVFVWSCAAERGDSQQTAAPVVQALEEAAEVRETLRARLDTSRLLLAPVRALDERDAFDGARALAGLEQVTGQSLEAQTSGSTWHAEGGDYSVSFDARSGALSLRAERSYERGLARAADAQLEELARTLLTGFASSVSKQTSHLQHLGSTTRVLGEDEPPSDERLGSKVFVIRRLGGIRVAGSRLVVSFATDGRLVSARGLWPAIELRDSQLTSSLSLEQASERALDVLLANGVNAEREDPIYLETFYQLEPAAEHSVVRLRAAAIVTAYDHEETPGRRVRHEFDL
jgi:hypothetical protein